MDEPVKDMDERFGTRRHVVLTGALRLDSGASLSPVEIAYETYGTLNADGSNAILICHALTGDQYVASTHPVTGKPGWWTRAVGPGLPIDPARPFVASCGSGVTACSLLFAAHLLGNESTQLYDGSWSEWGADPATPKALGPP